MKLLKGFTVLIVLLVSFLIVGCKTNSPELAKPNIIFIFAEGNMYSIRSGDWKYIDGLGSGGFTDPPAYDPEPNGPQGQLYNLKDDPTEKNNLYLQMPEKVMALKQELENSLK